MARRPAHSSFEQHPQLSEVLAVLTRVPRLTDDELQELAAHWRNTPAVAEARRAALSPDTLLVVDVLRAFDDIAAQFSADLDGEAAWCSLTPAVVSGALKAVRDAVAAVITRPSLSRSEYAVLSAPWREVLGRPEAAALRAADQAPVPPGPGADTGAQVDRLLAAVTGLGDRCHDVALAAAWDGLVVRAMTRDEEARDAALRSAHDAALLTGRQRQWSLLRRDAARGVAHRCASCTVPAAALAPAYDGERVAALVADAACALLVRDVAGDAVVDTLLAPLSGLVPLPRPTTEA